MSGDEDSFIVIEETPSMMQFSVLDSLSSNRSSEPGTDKNAVACEPNSSLFASALALTSNDVNASPPKSDKTAENASIKSTGLMQSIASTMSTSPQKSIESNGHQSSAPKSTLAHSFLLGDINCDTMKSFVPYTSNLSQKEDSEKWRNLIQERNELKDALQRTNATMRQQYTMVNDWHNCVKDLKENHDQELKKFRTINDELFQQNYDLQAKVAELQHLAELSRKNRLQHEDEQINALKSKNDQLESQMQNVKLELANAIAMNVDTDEAYRECATKCDRQNVELLAIQELYKNASVDVAALKEQNERMRHELEQTKKELTECHEQTHVIQAQCDVYRKDFEMERKQREEMAQEREQMIADITMLKRRNQALVDEAQSYYSETSANSLTSTVFNESIEDDSEQPKNVCPLCSESYETYNALESHVQSCLEKNG